MRHSFYCVFNFFTIIKFFINNLTSAFVTFMVTFHIKSLFYWNVYYFTYLKVCLNSFTWYTNEIFNKFSTYSFPIGSRVFNIDFLTISKLWQALQNASLQYLQLTKNFRCQNWQDVFWQYPHFKFSFWNFSNSFSCISLENFHLLSLNEINFFIEIFFD